MTITASCACGQLTATAAQPPLRAAICHCHACRTRTGSAFSWNSRFATDTVTTSGTSTVFARTGDDGGTVIYHFCPTCGVTVWYVNSAVDGIMIPVGAMQPGDLPAPVFSVYDDRRPEWLILDDAANIERLA